MLLLLCALAPCLAQAPAPPPPAEPAREHERDTLLKAIDDLAWQQKLSEIAVVDKVRFTGPPPRHNPNPTAQGSGNPVIIPAYTFIPQQAGPLAEACDGKLARESRAEGYKFLAQYLRP